MHFLLELGFFAVLVLLLLMREQRHLKLNGLMDIDQQSPQNSKIWRFVSTALECPQVVW